MEILVCIKQVPQVSKMKLDEHNNLIRDGVKSIVNPADLNALTMALELREIVGGNVTVLTMGPPSADIAIKECIAMGADKGYIVSSRNFKGSDTLATSYTLTMAIKSLGEFDIIFTGTQSIDGDTGQVGPELSYNLGMNLVGYVNKFEYTEDGLILYRQSEEGVQKVKSKLPLLVSVLRDSNSFVKLTEEEIEECSANIIILSDEDIDADPDKIGIEGSPTIVAGIIPPELREIGVIIKGDTAEEKVDNLINILKEKTTLGW